MALETQNKYKLDTPCLVLDLDILEKNLQKMQSIAGSAGKNLRPHAKTHKCSSLAKKQIEHGAIGICAAKVSEAEALAKAGIKDILVTGPASTYQKINRLVDILAIAPSLITAVDHPECIGHLSRRLEEKKRSMDVLLDINVGLNRTGVEPEKALELAEYIASLGNLRIRGIQAYAGHVQHIQSYEERRAVSHKCLEKAVNVFHQLKNRFSDITIFSASGTGTFSADLSIPEVTEFQVGSYVSMDSEYLAVEQTVIGGESTAFNPPLHLLTSVVSANQPGFVTVDAGLKSLYKDGGIPIIATPEYSCLRYDWFGDEYGKIISEGSTQLPAVGAVLELITSHCDPTINLFDYYFLTRGSEVIGKWEIDLRGCSQ